MTQPLQPPRIVARVGTMPKNHQKRYDDGTRTWQSMTKLLESIETDTWNLDEWKGNMTAIGLSMRPDLVLGVAASTQFDPATGKLTKDAKDAIRGLRRQAVDAAKGRAGMNQGNALHTATERLDLGETLESIGLPYPFDADLRAYDVLKRAMGLHFDPEHVERTVRIPELDVCGSFDRIGTSTWLEQQGMLQPGERIVVDMKTESAPLLNLMHIVPQQAGYSRGDAIWDPRIGDYVPMPKVSRSIALIIHIRDGRATPYVVNLAAGWKSALRAAEQRDEMRASKVKLGEPGAWAMALDVKLPAGTELVATMAAPELAAARGRAEQAAERAYRVMAGPEPQPLIPTPEIPATEIRGDVAVRRPDGMVTWQSAPADPAQQAINDIGQADSLADLAALFDRVTAAGVLWEGKVARAGELRGMVVQCPQRELHTSTGQCACGWRSGWRA